MNTEATHEENVAKTTGERLRMAREHQGLSQQAIAERLCLKLSTVRDIEDDKAPTDLAATFLRGYIRSYARLVHVPEDEILPMLAKQAPMKAARVQPMQSFSLGKRRKKRDGWLMSFTWLILFVVVGLTGAWWWQNHKAQQAEYSSIVASSDNSTHAATTDAGQSQSVPLDMGSHSADGAMSDAPAAANNAAPVASNATPVDTANTMAQPGTATNTAQSAAVNTTPAQSATTGNMSQVVSPSATDVPATVADVNALVMNFNADCWLEVTDGSGKKLFSGLQHNGGNLNLTGQLPYRLKIGAPAAVQVQFQGKPVDLSRFIRTNQVARLTLQGEASGVAQ